MASNGLYGIMWRLYKGIWGLQSPVEMEKTMEHEMDTEVLVHYRD